MTYAIRRTLARLEGIHHRWRTGHHIHVHGEPDHLLVVCDGPQCGRTWEVIR